VRERYTFYFRVIPLVPRTAAELNAAIMEAFAGYTPVWACQRGECPNLILDVGFNVTFNDHPREYKGSFEIYRCAGCHVKGLCMSLWGAIDSL
jgi:hypothetical protein